MPSYARRLTLLDALLSIAESDGAWQRQALKAADLGMAVPRHVSTGAPE
jgi:hypothetical protein